MASGVNPMTKVPRLRRARATSATDNGFPARPPQKARPAQSGTSAAQATTRSVVDWQDAPFVPNCVKVKLYGAGADNGTFSVRFYAWNYLIEDGVADTALWVPDLLCEFLVTLSTYTGIAGGLLITTDRFADTIAIVGTSANDDVSVDVVSPATDQPAHVVIDTKGAELFETTFTTGGSATNCNALLAFF